MSGESRSSSALWQWSREVVDIVVILAAGITGLAVEVRVEA